MPFLNGALERLRSVRRGSKDPSQLTNGTKDKPSLASGTSTTVSPQTTGFGSRKSTDTAAQLSVDGKSLSKHQEKKQAQKEEAHAKAIAEEKVRETARLRRLESDNRASIAEPASVRAKYGDLPMSMSQSRTGIPRMAIGDVSAAKVGEEILFRGRVHTARKMSHNLAFIVFRQGLYTLQGVVASKDGDVTKHMVKWMEAVPIGSIVLVKGLLQAPKEPIKGASIHDVELLITELHVISRRLDPVPFTVYEDDLSKPDKNGEDLHAHHVTDRARLNHRLLDLRTRTAKSIFRINAGLCNLFRNHLDTLGFIEIHTPKLQAGATESGASVFKVDYFGRPAFLAQSPQLAKQMAIAADFERVYEIGPVFRAENSNTHRHLTEYTGLDIEMSLDEHYDEMFDVIDGTLKHIFKGIYEKYRKEVDIIKEHYPHEDLVWIEKTPRIPFWEGVQMLVDSGYKTEDGTVPSPHEDLGTRDEIRLGQLVKEKYGTDFFALDKFPEPVRPFYAMPYSEDGRYTNSFDMFIRGQEILTGGQRIHDAKMLEEKMNRVGVDPKTMEDYMEGFRFAAPPHAGAGIGLERILMLFLGLGNVRWASLFPRDPKSIPAPPPKPQLRHPDDNTLYPPWDEFTPVAERKLQPLENLVANYGDSTNTSWMDDRYLIWRDPETGAAASYVPTGDFAILPGDPLCDPSQYAQVTASFLNWIKQEKHLKPIWILVGSEMESVLGDKMGWRTLSCVAEERVDADQNTAEHDQNVMRKVRHAEKEGVKITDVPAGEPLSDEVKSEIDDKVRGWIAGRQGRQIHLSEITPWRDQEHRRYFYSRDKDGHVCALVVLAQLSLKHGYQVKYSLDFKDAPSGTIEQITLHAIHAAKAAGTSVLSYGSAATAELTAMHNLTGTKIKMLRNTYASLAKQFKLTNKNEFRSKLGGVEDPVYVCFPPHGLGLKGSRAIVDFFEKH